MKIVDLWQYPPRARPEREARASPRAPSPLALHGSAIPATRPSSATEGASDACDPGLGPSLHPGEGHDRHEASTNEKHQHDHLGEPPIVDSTYGFDSEAFAADMQINDSLCHLFYEEMNADGSNRDAAAIRARRRGRGTEGWPR